MRMGMIFIFWMDLMVDLGGKNNLKLLFIFWIMVWNENENEVTFIFWMDLMVDLGGKNNLKLLFIFWSLENENDFQN
jgi:hypothetical protein